MTKIYFSAAFFLPIVFLCTLFSPHETQAFTEPAVIPIEKPNQNSGNIWIVASDATAGQIANPQPNDDVPDFITIEEADDNSSPVSGGDTVKIKGGTYYVYSIDKSGTGKGGEIVWEPYGNSEADSVRIIPAGDPIERGKGIAITASYIIFDGGEQKRIIFDATNCFNDRTSKTIAALHIQKWEYMSSDVTMRRLVIEKIGGPLQYPIVEGHEADGGALLVKSSNFRFYNNEVRDSMGMALYLYGNNLEVRNNYFHDLYSTAVQINPHTDYPPGYGMASEHWVSDGVHISGNIIKNVGRGRPKYGIVTMSSTDTDRDIFIYNNIITDSYGGIKRNPGAAEAQIRVFNNVLYDNDNYGFAFKEAESADVRIYNNITAANGLNDEFYSTFHIENNCFEKDIPTGGNGDGQDNCSVDFVSEDFNSLNFLQLLASNLHLLNQGTGWDTILNGTDFKTAYHELSGTDEVIIRDFFHNLRDDGVVDIGAHEYRDAGDIPPSLTQVKPVASPCTKPVYTFSSNEAGTIHYGGSCGNGNLANAVDFGTNHSRTNRVRYTLPSGEYSNCTIAVEDRDGNFSNTLTIPPFTVIPSTVSNLLFLPALLAAERDLSK